VVHTSDARGLNQDMKELLELLGYSIKTNGGLAIGEARQALTAAELVTASSCYSASTAIRVLMLSKCYCQHQAVVRKAPTSAVHTIASSRVRQAVVQPRREMVVPHTLGKGGAKQCTAVDM
jgi:hypothetical protein